MGPSVVLVAFAFAIVAFNVRSPPSPGLELGTWIAMTALLLFSRQPRRVDGDGKNFVPLFPRVFLSSDEVLDFVNL